MFSTTSKYFPNRDVHNPHATDLAWGYAMYDFANNFPGHLDDDTVYRIVRSAANEYELDDHDFQVIREEAEQYLIREGRLSVI